ncbi:MAG: hypothetical protein U1F34_07050 [Gammaproteobacteria bacterium]
MHPLIGHAPFFMIDVVFAKDAVISKIGIGIGDVDDLPLRVRCGGDIAGGIGDNAAGNVNDGAERVARRRSIESETLPPTPLVFADGAADIGASRRRQIGKWRWWPYHQPKCRGGANRLSLSCRAGMPLR